MADKNVAYLIRLITNHSEEVLVGPHQEIQNCQEKQMESTESKISWVLIRYAKKKRKEKKVGSENYIHELYMAQTIF